jgi:hypothetical protein
MGGFMENVKSKEEFEAWARMRSLDLEYRNIPGVGQFYECPRTLLALEAWQASRESLVIELPKVSDYFDAAEYPHTCEALERDLRAAIESVGLKAKS